MYPVHKTSKKRSLQRATLYKYSSSYTPKIFCKTIKTLENKNMLSHLSSVIKTDDIDYVNKYFAKSGCVKDKTPNSLTNSPTSQTESCPPASRHSHPFTFWLTHEFEVLTELLSLGTNKLARMDGGGGGVDPFFLKTSAHVTATSICGFFNLSLQTRVLSQEWKSAAVTPMFKGGDNADLSCYRVQTHLHPAVCLKNP